LNNEMIMEVQFSEISQSNMTVGIVPVCNVLPNATQIFEGVVFQNLLDMYYVSIFPKEGIHQQIKLPELQKYRLIDAKFENNVLMVLAEQAGTYEKFIFHFKQDYTYTLRKVMLGKIASDINFTVLDTGLAIQATDSEVELFTAHQVKTISSDTLYQTQLFHRGTEVLFAKGNELYSITMKK